MKKKYYIISIAFVLIGITLGIFYLTVIRTGNAELPQDVVLTNAFNEEHAFNEQPKKARLIEFMYTHCPDVCPVTSLEMSKLRNQLIEEGVFGDKIEFITITVDPKRDTPEVLQDYASRFEVTSPDDGWKFLTGSEEDIRKTADSLGFLFKDPGSGEIIHSTWVYFMDENNNLAEKFTMGEDFDRERVYKRILRTIK